MKKINFILTALALIVIGACNSDEDIIEIPVSDGAVLDIGIGGPKQPNQVFIDLSMDTQTSVDRSTWDLGFYSGDQFSVILNASAEVMARSIGKSNFDDVTAEDYEGLGEQMTVDAIFSNLFSPPPYPEWMSESSQWIDDPDGNLNNTAIASISANDSENDIYLINRGFTSEDVSRGESILVKVSRNGNGYTLQYQTPGATTVESVDITKNEELNFVGFDFDNGVVDVEPTKDSWDIIFSTTMVKLDVGGGILIPYAFQDYVLQNRNGVTVAEVEVGEENDLLSTYEGFTLGDVAGLEFDERANAIGDSWRTVASPTPGTVTGVRTDGFYVLKDVSGNQYKLLFTGMLNETGERGYPQITYELLK